MTAAEAAERLRRKAVDYDLSAVAAKDRGDAASAVSFSLIAIALYEVAECMDEEEE